MIFSMKLLRALTVAALATQTAALAIGGKQMLVERDSDGLQNIVSALFTSVEPQTASIGHLGRQLIICWIGYMGRTLLDGLW